REQEDSQPLLWPLEVDVSEEAEGVVMALRHLGIECRWMGGKRIAIDALPSSLEAAHFHEFFLHWQEGKKLAATTVQVCRRLKKWCSFEEAKLLWSRIQKCEDRYYDPSGHRIWMSFSEKNFEQLMNS